MSTNGRGSFFVARVSERMTFKGHDRGGDAGWDWARLIGLVIVDDRGRRSIRADCTLAFAGDDLLHVLSATADLATRIPA